MVDRAHTPGARSRQVALAAPLLAAATASPCAASDLADFAIFRSGMHTDPIGLTAHEAYCRGDLNGDMQVAFWHWWPLMALVWRLRL